jgi:hypothetical protein
MGFKSNGALGPVLLIALSESVESATSAIAHGDVQKLEFEIARIRRLLSRVPGSSVIGGTEVMGDDGDGVYARDQQKLRAVLAHQLAIFGCVVHRSLRTVTALRALLPSADGTYSPLVSQRRD